MRFTPRAGALWALALVLERALSGYAVAAFPMAKNTGLAHTFATAADKTAVRRVLAVLAAVLCVGMAALGGWALVLAALAVLWRYHAVSRKQFGGITGDLDDPAVRRCYGPDSFDDPGFTEALEQIYIPV